MRPIQSVRETSAGFEAALERAAARLPSGTLESAGTDSATDEAMESLRREAPDPALSGAAAHQRFALEAIILADLRPARFIDNDVIAMDGAYDYDDMVRANKERLENVARSIGRVDLLNHTTLDFAGTGWLIDRDVVVTNRHVAEVFARADGFGGHEMLPGAFGRPLEQRVDMNRQRQEDRLPRRRLDVLEVLYLAPARGPDIALLRVVPPEGMDPLDLDTARIDDRRPVAAIGYPAWDPRNDERLMADIFGTEFDVKRFSPGLVTQTDVARGELLTDYSSLGGNSGSAVVDLGTGKVVGLHFAGVFRQSNYAVTAEMVDAARRGLKTVVAGAAIVETEATPPARFAGRDGYVSTFLGEGDLEVPLPGLGARAEDVAPVLDAADDVLRYRHFSVIQSSSRRLPMLTAVNIDGTKAFRLKRRDRWNTDGRVAEAHQADNALYRNNPLDRGHMVRRQDPGWGDSRAEAQEGEDDTFHYTNCAPQHERLNQKHWVDLEDYILDNASTRGFRASVFTGPVFGETDRRLRRQPGAEDIRIPEGFWKIAVMVNDDTGALSATGYMLSQGEMIRRITEAAFVFGEFMVYQVPIRTIEAATGFDFGALPDHDPLNDANESVFGEGVIEIHGPGSLRL